MTFDLSDVDSFSQLPTWVARIRAFSPSAVIIAAGHHTPDHVASVSRDECTRLTLSLSSRKSPCVFQAYNTLDVRSARNVFEQAALLTLHHTATPSRRPVSRFLRSMAQNIRARLSSPHTRPRTLSHSEAADAFDAEYCETPLSSSAPTASVTPATTTSTSAISVYQQAPVSFRIAMPEIVAADTLRPTSMPTPHVTTALEPRPHTMPPPSATQVVVHNLQLHSPRNEANELLDESTLEPIFANPAALLEPSFYRMSRELRLASLRRRQDRPRYAPVPIQASLIRPMIYTPFCYLFMVTLRLIRYYHQQ